MRLNLRGVELLQPDDMVRIDGDDEVIDHVERCQDRHHWRIHLVGCARPRIVPNGAQYRLLNGGAA